MRWSLSGVEIVQVKCESRCWCKVARSLNVNEEAAVVVYNKWSVVMLTRPIVVIV